MTLLKDVQLGELSYNGLTFDSMHKSKVSNRVVLDDAGRAPKWNEVTIVVEADIDLKTMVDAGFASFSAAVTDVLRTLNEPGGELIYKNKGFGDFYVNSTQSNVRDLAYGPKPEVIEFTPIGGNQVVHVVWKVVTCVTHCAGASHRDHVFNMTWDASYDIDSDGYLTVTTNGSFEVPATYPGTQGAGGPLTFAANSSADEWWKRVCPLPRVGFKRLSRPRKLSRDRRRIEFTIVDQELPVPLPPDCTMMDARHRVRASRGARAAFQTWNCTISATVRVNPKLPRSTTWNRFMIMAQNRIKHARQFNNPASVLLMDIDVDEDVFGKDAKFSVSYHIIGSPLSTILQRSGLWILTPGTSHASWTRSMKQVYAPHGINGALFSSGDDIMIDLCHAPAVKRPEIPTEPNRDGETTNDAGTHAFAATGVVKGATDQQQYWFPPENSWLTWNSDLWFEEDDNVVRHKPLAGKVKPGTPKVQANGSVAPVATDTAMEFSLADWDTPDILQQVCSPDTSVSLVGTAMRFGYRINPPRLKKFGGKEVTQTKNLVIEKQLGAMQGIPIWGLAWRIEYALTEPANDMPALANPLLRLNGSDNPPLTLPTFISG